MVFSESHQLSVNAASATPPLCTAQMQPVQATCMHCGMPLTHKSPTAPLWQWQLQQKATLRHLRDVQMCSELSSGTKLSSPKCNMPAATPAGRN